ncbi:serine hydrolase [uncultured Hydrogenophaga sp.]|uniref:serine hydrolase n=1 Tax=uncultured Hydrogenophaga sp. TaxID=199683 RepID=UPI003748F9C2
MNISVSRWRRAIPWVGSVLAICLGLTGMLLPSAQAAEPRSAATKKAQVQKKKPAVKNVARKQPSKKTAVAQKSSGKRKSAVVASSRKSGTKVQARRVSVQVGATAVARDMTPVRLSAPARLSVGEQLGLRAKDDPLDLNSSVALVVDQDTNEVLFSKNDHAILPIASLTKLMTGLIVADAHLDMNEMITITQDDVDTYKGSRSRLAVGTRLTRGELMHLSLMSSENRAAHALGRTYPGGMTEFVRLMNLKARELGMADTRYVEPTGLSSENRSSARDLATLVSVAYERPILRDLSTSPGYEVDVGQRTLQFNNSNRLVKNPQWDIGLQKTGYISEAGRCLVMQAQVAGRKLIMVFLDATGKLSRLEDAERVRKWLELQPTHPVAVRPQG